MYALLFLLGLAVGSFINVIALRYDPDRGVFDVRSIGGRSHCPECKTQLRSYDLIPLISFLMLRAKCRYCRHPLSFRYPIVEFISGALFLLPVYFADKFAIVTLGEPFALWQLALIGIWVLAFATLLLISLIDLQFFIIPDVLNVFLAALGAAKIAILAWAGQFNAVYGTFLGNYAELFGVRENIFLNAALGILIGAGFLGAIVIVTRGRGMGLGDVKLAAAFGILFGWPDVFFVIIFAFFIGAMYAVRLLAVREKSLKDAVPFGPFLALGALTMVLFGHEILRLYFSVFHV